MSSYFNRDNDNKLIVFIHGITGDEHTTWTNEKSNFIFPKMLHEELIGYSSYSFSYDSNYYKTSSEFYEIIEDLTRELNNINAPEFDEIIFIAHSMGGLIAKTLLIDSRVKDITEKTTKVILLATPNNGSFFPKLLQHLSQNIQFEYLTQIHDNEYLQILTKMWITEYGKNGTSANSIQCYCGYEELKVGFKLIVPLGDVSSPCCDLLQSFNKNHISISKPFGNDDEVYKWTKYRIEYMLSEIERLSKKALMTLYETKIKNLEKKLLDIEQKFIQNLSSELSDNNKSEYYSIFLEKTEHNLAFKELDKIITNYKESNSEQKFKLLLQAIEKGELNEALEIFSNDEIDAEIIRIQKDTKALATKIKIKIGLYRLQNDNKNIHLSFERLLKIERSDENLLAQANFFRHKGKVELAYDQYLLIVNRTDDSLIKANCLNNLGTFSNDKFISYNKGNYFLQQAIKIYESSLYKESHEDILVSLLESEINLTTFNAITASDFSEVTKSYKKLKDKIENLDKTTEDYLRLKFNLDNNYIASCINSKEDISDTESIENLISSNDSILDSLIKNNQNVNSKYSNIVAQYYFNKGSFFGNLYNEDIGNYKLSSLAIENYRTSLNYRKNILHNSVDNIYNIIFLEQNMAVIYADIDETKLSLSIYKECLLEIEKLIEKDKDNKIKYYELIVEILLGYATTNPDCNENILKCRKAIDYLDKLNELNENVYNLIYVRIYITMCSNMLACKKSNNEIKKIHQLGIEKIKGNTTNEAIILKETLLDISSTLNL